VKELERAVAREVRGLTLDPGFAVEMRRHVHDALTVQQQGEREARYRLSAQLKKLDVQESNLLDIAADGEVAADTVKARLRSLAVQRRTLVDKLARSDQQIQRHADVVLAYLDLLERPYSFYVSASEPIKRRILEAFFSVLWIEDESDQVRAQGQVHEPIALIQAAAAEWAATHAKSASDTADALDSTPSNLYLKAICSSKTSLVGLVERYSNNSTGVAKLRQLANLKPSRVAGANRPAPRRARRLTDSEKLVFVEGYQRGEQIADLARRLGVHRTTLDMLVARLKLSRVDPNEVPEKVRDDLVEKYRVGESLAAIGEECGFSANKVQRLLVSMGEPIRPRGPKKPAVTSEQVQQMVSQYEQGEAIAAIAESVGISYAHTRSCLLDAGVQMRPRGGAR